MNSSVKVILLIVGFLIVWGVLAAADAGVLGLGVILSLAALLDLVSSKDKPSMTIWLIIVLAALILSLAGIALKKIFPDMPSMDILISAISLVLIAAYFFIGRKRRLPST